MRFQRTLSCSAALIIALCRSSFAQPCSQATVRGAWGFQGRGTVMLNPSGSSSPVPVPYVELGTMTIDDQGRYTAHGTASLGGRLQETDRSGSLKVNPDCTAADTYASGSFQGAGQWVILGDGNEMRALQTKSPAGPAAGVYSVRRISSGEPHCTGDMVRGAYGGTGEGTSMIEAGGQLVPVPFASILSMTFQPSGFQPVGRVTVSTTASLGGSVFIAQFPNVSIAVHPDCTATLKWSAPFSGQTAMGTNKYIVLDNGNELIGMVTEDSTSLPVALEHHKRVSRVP
jgi:hypothetical protein